MSEGVAPPLAGLRVVEFEGIGPGPHAAMLLSDMGAEVLRIGRDGGNGWPNIVMDRGRASLLLDLRSPEGCARARDAARLADVVIEGMRPGVMERLGLGPEPLLAENPRLIYGRVTGWGQDGPLAKFAGHDLNYIALTGALAAIGAPDRPPPPPLNLIGDFGGGSMLLAIGILAALLERERSGRGQVVDAAILDGVASMMGMFTGLAGQVSLERDRNLLGGAAPFYRCYACADGRWLAVGAIEPRFYAELLERIGAPAELAQEQMTTDRWEAAARTLAAIFATRPLREWTELLEHTDACVTPVLRTDEAARHPHMAFRGTYSEVDGVIHPAAAPRFSRTPARVAASTDGATMLARWRT